MKNGGFCDLGQSAAGGVSRQCNDYDDPTPGTQRFQADLWNCMNNPSLAERRAAQWQVSSTELTTHMLQRIKAHDSVLNGFVTVTEGWLWNEPRRPTRIAGARRAVDPLSIALGHLLHP